MARAQRCEIVDAGKKSFALLRAFPSAREQSRPINDDTDQKNGVSNSSIVERM